MRATLVGLNAGEIIGDRPPVIGLTQRQVGNSSRTIRDRETRAGSTCSPRSPPEARKLLYWHLRVQQNRPYPY